MEQQAHSVNLQLALDGDCDIECASLVLHFPAHVGLDIAEDVSFNVHRNTQSAKRPHVEISGDVIRVSENYERLPTRRSFAAFGQPLRVVIDSKTAGHKIPIHYRIHGRNLRFPVSGKLYIICAA